MTKVDKEGNVMMGVRLIQADLSTAVGNGRRMDPVVLVKCEKTRKFSRTVMDVSVSRAPLDVHSNFRLDFLLIEKSAASDYESNLGRIFHV